MKRRSYRHERPRINRLLIGFVVYVTEVVVIIGLIVIEIMVPRGQIVSYDGVEFLGFIFHGIRGTIQVSPKSLKRFKHQTRQVTGRSRGISMEDRLSRLRSYVRGWMGYFGIASQLKLFDKLDQWIRRRIRMCYWKRWRHVRMRRREPIGLGVPRRQAIRHAKSRKGPWHMSKSIATGVGMTNAWLGLQGVISLKSLRASLAPLR